MSLHITAPCEELKCLVSHFWEADWDIPSAATHTTYFLTANSLTEIAFGFTGDTLLFASVQGHTSTHGQFPAGDFCRIFGVSLYSYALPFLFGIPASALTDRFISPETLMGYEGKRLTEQIALAAGTPQRIQILTAFFTSQLKLQRPGDRLIMNAAQHIRRNKGNIHITGLSDDFCLSQKQFERRFKAGTGFNPKVYARISRFETFLNNRTHYKSLTEAAYAGGYYDQAHFIHDFKAFTGYSPSRFFALSGY